MRIKAICDLNQLSDTKLLNEVSKGMYLIINNSMKIYSDAQKLIEMDGLRGHQILKNIASEKAAKFFILLDAIRCGRENNDAFSKQLKRYNNHLAKGLYAEYYETKPSNFKEVREWIDKERQEFYLDGPNDVDWIFHNWTLQQREEKIYVDYMENDGEHQWLSPERYDDMLKNKLLFKLDPKVIQISATFYNMGITKPEVLKLIASKWRPVKMKNNFTLKKVQKLNKETLEELEDNHLLENVDKSATKLIIDNWLFPIYSISMTKIKVNKGKLKEIQENWSPW